MATRTSLRTPGQSTATDAALALTRTQRRRLARQRTALVRETLTRAGLPADGSAWEVWQRASSAGLPIPAGERMNTLRDAHYRTIVRERDAIRDLVPATGMAGTRAPARAGKKAKQSNTSAKGGKDAPSDGMSQAEIAASLGADESLQGGTPRQTLPFNANVLGSLPWNFLPRRQYQSLDLTTLQEGAYNAQQLLDLLADAWPELSLAMWNFARLAATDYHYEVRTADNKEEDTQGKAALDDLLSRVNRHWGGFDALIAQWVMSVVLQGACAGETVPNADVTDVVDIVTVQPWTIFFQRDLDQNYLAFQWQPMLAIAAGNGYNADLWSQQQAATKKASTPPPPPSTLLAQQAMAHGGFRLLNELTFAYVPLDSEVDDPYGRAPFAPVMQLVAFDMQMLKDLRQWSHINAWGRIDVSVVYEKAEQMMPEAVKADPKKAKTWRDQYLRNIQQAYNSLNADDTFIHWDNVAVDGVDSSGKTLDIDKLMKVLERRIFRALKQLPILMGSNEGTTETWGSIQMEVYAKGVNSIQRVVASLVEKLLTVALRIMGRSSVVTFEFDQLRSTQRIQDANAEQMEIKNAAAKRDEGWITQDEASILVTGSKAVADAPGTDAFVAPLQMDAAGPQPAPEADPDSASSDPTDPNQPNQQQKPPTPPANGGKDGKDGNQPNQPAPKAHKQAEEPQEDAKKASEPYTPPADSADSGKGAKGGKGASGSTSGRDPVPATRMASPVLVAPVDTGAIEAPLPEREVDLTPSTQHTGIMCAFMLDPDAARALAEALPEGIHPDHLEKPGDYHVTLTYHGDVDKGPTEEDLNHLRNLVGSFAYNATPLGGDDGTAGQGRISGVGRFCRDDGQAEAVHALVDYPGLQDFRRNLVEAMERNHVPASVAPRTTFDYQPHVTLAYLPPDVPTPFHRLPAIPLRFTSVTLCIGGQREAFPIGAPPPDPTDPNPEEGRALPKDEPAPQAGSAPQSPQASERQALERAVQQTLALALVDTARDAQPDQPAQVQPDERPRPRPQSAARRALVRNMTTEVAAHFRQARVSHDVLEHAVALHTDRAVASNQHIWPDLREAVALCVAAQDGHGAQTRLTPEQKQALIYSLMQVLAGAFPDEDAALATILVDYRLQAWDEAGQEALEEVGLSGSFHLTNSALIDAVRTVAAKSVQGIQATTRERLADVIAGDLERGATVDSIASDVQQALAQMASTRADTIGETEMASAWGEARMQTFGRNGVVMKVWATGDDPDPGSKRNAPCLDNSYAGAIPMFSAFPSGDYAPPAHPYCVCDLVAAGNPSDAALANPWTGGDDLAAE